VSNPQPAIRSERRQEEPDRREPIHSCCFPPRQAPNYPRDLQIIPTDSVGSFVYSGGTIALNDLRGKGVRFTGLAGVELQGWLKVAAPGRTQIAVEYRANGVNALGTSDCIANAWLEVARSAARPTK
jgi:hypothetical protein